MKTMLITGSSRGIGAEIARLAFLSGEYNVIINYNKSLTLAAELKKELENISQMNPQKAFGKVIIFGADVSKEHDVNEMFANAENHFETVDVLVNNAAMSSFSLFTDLTYEEWNNTMSTNVGSVFLCSKRALKNMIHKKSGKIINISSVWGICGSSCEVHYSASKAAIIGLTKSLAKEVGPSGITVNCIAPGVINTDMNSSLSKETITALCQETPLGKIGTCADIAKTVLFLAGTGGDFITGQVISPNGGLVI